VKKEQQHPSSRHAVVVWLTLSSPRGNAIESDPDQHLAVGIGNSGRCLQASRSPTAVESTQRTAHGLSELLCRVMPAGRTHPLVSSNKDARLHVQPKTRHRTAGRLPSNGSLRNQDQLHRALCRRSSRCEGWRALGSSPGGCKAGRFQAALVLSLCCVEQRAAAAPLQGSGDLNGMPIT
jgi:hypothetical protein